MGLLENLFPIFGAITVSCAAIFSIRKLRAILFPIKIVPVKRFVFDENGDDEVQAIVTNMSKETIYIVECRAISVNSAFDIFRTETVKDFV